jgi:terminase large subunit-like protein
MIVETTPSIYGRFDRWRIVRSMFGVPNQLSLATWVAHDEDRITRFTNWLQNTLDPNAIKSIKSDWGFWARGSQFPPNDGWDVWLISAGRGFGKTRVGAEIVNHWAESVPGCMILMVGRTSEEVRDVMVYGISGVIRVARDTFRPVYEPSQTRLRWPNGSLAYTFSADVPDSLRGRNANFAWGDEVASWSKDREAFDNLMKCLRVGEHPQVLLTTTPKAGSYVVRRIMDLTGDLREIEGLMTEEELERRHYARGGRVLEAAPDLRCVTTVGNSYENLQNMSASYIKHSENLRGHIRRAVRNSRHHTDQRSRGAVDPRNDSSRR